MSLTRDIMCKLVALLMVEVGLPNRIRQQNLFHLVGIRYWQV